MCVFVFVCALLRVCVCARVSFFFGREPGPEVQIEPQSRWRIIIGVCVECLIGAHCICRRMMRMRALECVCVRARMRERV